MKRVSALFGVVFLIFVFSGIASVSAQEAGQPQLPGLDLNAPGDMYRYTFFLDKKHLNDDWKLV